MLETARDIFLIVASICAVLLTILAAALMVYLIKVAIAVRSLAELLHTEAGRLIERRRAIAKNLRFARRWAALFVDRALRG